MSHLDAEIERFFRVEDDHDRYVHFNGEHVQDPPPHGECAPPYTCPYADDEDAADD